MSSAIGIDLGSHGIALVHVSRRHGQLHVLAMQAVEGSGRASAGDDPTTDGLLVETLRKTKAGPQTAVVIGLPYEKVFFSHLRTDVANPEDVRRLLKFELEDDLPLSFDDLVADICSRRSVEENRHEYLIAAVSRDQIEAWTRALRQAGCRCSVCSTDVCALQAVARLVRPADPDTFVVSVHADGRRMVLGLSHGETILCARHMACTGNAAAINALLAREIELTLRRTPGGPRPQPVEILLSGPAELVRELAGGLSQATGYAVRALGSLPVSSTPAAELDGRFALALGLALLGLDRTGKVLNFLSADSSQVDRADKSRARRAVSVFGVLLLAVVVLLGVQAWRGLCALETQRAVLTREIRAVFLETFPGEKKVVNELAQTTEHLQSLQKEHDRLAAVVGKRLSPLRMLHLLSERMASDKRIGISSFSIREGTIQLAGTGDSFEAIDQFLDTLRQVPEFGSVELEDMAQSRGNERPEFRLLISVKTG
ncbi:MAG: type II secretion system protein GspL [Planctomycetes bacterium]|jgi:type II secretion system protein L|nr:type II secretion system protein GspL [Planctomycetota bacterium]